MAKSGNLYFVLTSTVLVFAKLFYLYRYSLRRSYIYNQSLYHLTQAYILFESEGI